ncbi:hypothetical protein BDK51DRAFT_36880 [Blyttiomyces helicus]|uniref:Uncharacterized protein n=1 Tax=Blyttiomyces helicus TaxID=388810 RepID=A0A4P9W122_9FUNG|nr:hypothetical protein BDK51DRAFT_36880 [Blyttiomyces helicus]|eukprot:RKO85804.1 hypothetical protein BDK51DRAFT_36880 [Blyttiomyces helicus]
MPAVFRIRERGSSVADSAHLKKKRTDQRARGNKFRRGGDPDPNDLPGQASHSTSPNRMKYPGAHSAATSSGACPTEMRSPPNAAETFIYPESERGSTHVMSVGDCTVGATGVVPNRHWNPATSRNPSPTTVITAPPSASAQPGDTLSTVTLRQVIAAMESKDGSTPSLQKI